MAASAGGLTDDLDIARDGILIARALSKGAHAAQTLNVVRRPLDCLCNVLPIVLKCALDAS